jgi:hypothetical protein
MAEGEAGKELNVIVKGFLFFYWDALQNENHSRPVYGLQRTKAS